MVFIDLHLFTEEQEENEALLFRKYASNINYSYFLPPEIHPIFVQYAGFSSSTQKKNVHFIVEKAEGRSRLRLFFGLFKRLRQYRPQVILMHGMIAPWNIILARLLFGRHVKLMVQNHAEQPFGPRKRWIQKLAGRCISAYLFVSGEQAQPWLAKGIIRTPEKVHEVMEGSTDFRMKNKPLFKERTGCAGVTVFLWVGRLDRNKDPLTVLNAFARYAAHKPKVKLWMVFSTTGLLEEVAQFILEHRLSPYVSLVGKLSHAELEDYYNAADYFVLGSHYEGSGYALCEAMACGCIPVVTDIPSFRSMLDHGDFGQLFKPGDAGDLYSALLRLETRDTEQEREKVIRKFRQDLSFEAIARRISQVASGLVQE